MNLSHITRRQWLAGMTAGAAATSLAACSSGSGSDSSKLTWWATDEVGSVSASTEIWQATADRFAEATGVQVEIEVIPWSDLLNRTLTAITSGTGPDVLNLGTTWTAELHDTGALEPVTDDALSSLGGADKFVQNAWDSTLVPGADSRTSVPLIAKTYSLYYNESLFESAGIATPPATWEEFMAVAKELTVDTDGDGTIDQWGLTMPLNSPDVTHMAFIFGRQEGGSFVDDQGDLALSSPAQYAGIKRFVDLVTEDHVMAPNDVELTSGSEAASKLVNGTAAMQFTQNPGPTFENRDFTEWGIGQMPVPEGADNIQSMIAGTNVGVSTTSKRQEQAWEFVGHLTSPEEQAILADAIGALPIATDAYDLDPLAGEADESLEVKREILTEASEPFPLVTNIGQITTVVRQTLTEAFQAYAVGDDVDLEERLKEADQKFNQGA